jgi:hypothetical protein
MEFTLHLLAVYFIIECFIMVAVFSQEKRFMKALFTNKTALIQSLITTFVMSVIMSGLITALNTPIDVALFGRWFDSFLVAWPIAFVVGFFVMPQSAKLTQWLVGPNPA